MYISATGSVTAQYSTIASNTAAAGAGINGGGVVDLFATIIADNTGGDCFGAPGSAFTSFGSNLDTDDSCGLDQTSDRPDEDPQLAPLVANGGPTRTHALLAGSAAIDAVVAAVPADCIAVDQRGAARPRDGDGSGSAACDIGAYEKQRPFTDIDGSFAYDNIIWLADVAITLGCNVERTLFCPTLSVTREQMASFLVRALDLPPTSTDYFVDDEGSLHENDINALRAANITTGCGTDTLPGSPTVGQPIYCPSFDVTREQMASFIARGLAFAGMPLPEPVDDYFDDDEASAFHENDINKMYEAGITLGCGGRNYCPTLPVTREQMAAFLYRALAD